MKKSNGRKVFSSIRVRFSTHMSSSSLGSSIPLLYRFKDRRNEIISTPKLDLTEVKDDLLVDGTVTASARSILAKANEFANRGGPIK